MASLCARQRLRVGLHTRKGIKVRKYQVSTVRMAISAPNLATEAVSYAKELFRHGLYVRIVIHRREELKPSLHVLNKDEGLYELLLSAIEHEDTVMVVIIRDGDLLGNGLHITVR